MYGRVYNVCGNASWRLGVLLSLVSLFTGMCNAISYQVPGINYPHTLQHHTKYVVLYVRIHVTSTRHRKSKHSRLVPLDVLSDSDNFEGCCKVIPGQVKDSEELT